ncbi:MAG: penicillin-binding protein [Myxococcales bacterium]|nr:penicillin-binding protein [Myxococcales bacterium]
MVFRANGPRPFRTQVLVTLGLFALVVMFLAFSRPSGSAQPKVRKRHASLFHLGFSDAPTPAPKPNVPALAPIKPGVITQKRLEGFDPKLGRFVKGRWVVTLPDQTRVTTTIDPHLQKLVAYLFRTAEVPFGAFVAIDVRTGKVLAFVEHSSEQPQRRGLARQAIAPAASVFKVITTAALLELAKLSPRQKVCYHGGRNGIRESNLRDDPKRDRRCTTVTEALGKSTNAVFGKLAHKYLTTERLQRFASQFGFNAELPFVLPAETGRALVPRDPLGMANTAAGFWNTTLSPLHAAMIVQSIANGGVMMRPYLVEDASRNGVVVMGETPLALRRTVSPHVAGLLKQMMLATTEHGSARRYFSRRKEALRGIKVAGKTGSLSSRSGPYLHYSWFVGLAPLEKPTIAIAAFVGNRAKWKIKSAYVAREALTVWFQHHPPK